MAVTKPVTDAALDNVNYEKVAELYQQYQYDHIAAIRAASKIQRELSRAEHEVNRVAQHLQRIEAFCKQHDVPLESK